MCDVDFLPRGSLAYEVTRLDLAIRLFRDRLPRPMVRVADWLARWLP